MSELTQEIIKAYGLDDPDRDKGSTHWEGCYLSHPYCAILKLCEQVEAFEGDIDIFISQLLFLRDQIDGFFDFDDDED